jgi:hypothetical protein
MPAMRRGRETIQGQQVDRELGRQRWDRSRLVQTGVQTEPANRPNHWLTMTCALVIRFFDSLCPGSNPGRVVSKTPRTQRFARGCRFHEHSMAVLRNNSGTYFCLFGARQSVSFPVTSSMTALAAVLGVVGAIVLTAFARELVGSDRFSCVPHTGPRSFPS